MLEDEVLRRYDLRGTSAHRGSGVETIVYRNRRAAGKFVYADVYLGGEARAASYVLTATSQP